MSAFRSGAVNPPIKDQIYKDLNISFIPNPITNKIGVLKNEDAIKKAVRNVVLTNNGEKFFKPLYGGNITALLFENFSVATAQKIKTQIRRSVNRYEPRVDVLDVQVEDIPDRNTLNVKIIFKIIATNSVTETSISLERIR